MTILQYLGGKKRIPRGAISRVSEYIGQPWHRTRLYIFGVETPDDSTARLIQDFVHSRQPISALKPGPKGPRKAKISKKVLARFS
tara:strand:+ start:182 stop:436 length:255 start_codon:yes stop_codon:yes gene_type:complete